jgi:PAS domain S-box-containing protein
MNNTLLHQQKINGKDFIKRLTALITVAAIIGLILLGLLLRQEKQQSSALAEAFHQSEISLIQQSFETEISSIQNDLFVLGDSSEVAIYSANPDDAQAISEMNRIFHNFQDKNNSYRTLALYSPEGNLIVKVTANGTTPFPPSHKDSYHEDPEILNSLLPSIRTRPEAREPTLLFSLPVLNKNNEIICHLQIDYNMIPLISMIHSHSENRPDDFYGFYFNQQKLFESPRADWNLSETIIQSQIVGNAYTEGSAYTHFIDFSMGDLIQNKGDLPFSSNLVLYLLIQSKPPSLLYIESMDIRIFMMVESALFILWIFMSIYLARSFSQREYARNQERLMGEVFESLNDSLIITNNQRKIIYANPSFCMMMGYSQDELLEKSFSAFRSENNTPAYYRSLLDSLAENGIWEGKLWERTRTGDEILKWVKIQKIVLTNESMRYYGVYSDIDPTRDTRILDYHSTYYDMLTDLPNETLLPKLLSEALQPHKRSEKEMAVAVIQLNENEETEKTEETEESTELRNQAIKQIAKKLIEEISQSQGILSRSGIMEFTLTFPMLHSKKDLFAKLARVKSRLEESETDIAALPFSIGLALYPTDGDQPNTLLEQARIQATQHTPMVFQDKHLSEAYRRYLVISASLKDALEKNQFQLHFQPQVDPRTAKPVAMESLIRWFHPELGSVSPVEFISIAENNGMIIPIGEWIFKEACTFQRAMLDKGIQTIPISVNISMGQLEDPHFIEWIHNFRNQCTLPKELIELEFTESLLMQNISLCKSRLKTLSDLGFKLSIDDFGTGYSSLAYLKELSVDKIKIDRLFIKDYPTTDDGQVLRSIAKMLKALSYPIVMEGVETEEQHAYALDLNLDLIQGNYYSRPLASDDAEAYLST